MSRLPFVVTLVFSGSIGCIACDNGATVLNAAPSVTAVGPVTLEADGVHAYVWIRDHERNAADLTLELVTGGTANPVSTASGHGLRGLTTVREPIGEPHLLIFQAASVGTNAPIRLRVTARDELGGEGLEVETPEFTLDEGLPTP